MTSRLSAIQLMLTAVVLWSLYPPIVNLLLSYSSPMALAAVVHLTGAFAALAICLLKFRVRPIRVLRDGMVEDARTAGGSATRRYMIYVGVSGVLSAANHLCLFYALNASARYDATAILIFETWPVLFFAVDTVIGRSGMKVKPSDWIYVGVTFLGFALLMSQRIDLAEWIILDQTLIEVATVALIGSLMMTGTVVARRRANLQLKDLPDHPLARPERRIMTTEMIARFVSGGLILLAATSFERIDIQFGPTYWLLAIATGAVFVIGGSVFYHTALLKHPNASITAMWYLMPAGSLIFLALIEWTPPNAYETVAAVLIVSANFLLALKLVPRSAFLRLYVFLVVIGIVLVAVPPFSVPDFLDVVAVSSIFYVLLITHALSAQQDRNRQRERTFVSLSGHLLRAHDAEPPETRIALARYLDAVFNLFRMGNRDRSERFLNETAMRQRRRVERVAGTAGESWHRSVDSLNELAALSGDRLGGGLTVILTLLFAFNIAVVMLMREAGPIFDIFALLVAAVEAYLFFLVLERDGVEFVPSAQRSAMRQALAIKMLWNRDIPDGSERARAAAADRAQIASLPGRNDADGMNAMLGFVILGFVLVGLSYAIAYKHFGTPRYVDNNPLEIRPAGDAAELVIGYPSWPTARVQAEILSQVMAEFLDVEAAFAEMSSPAMFRQMDRGDGVDVHPEVWSEPLADLLRRYVDGFSTVRYVPSGISGWQGYCVNGPGRDVLGDGGVGSLATPEIARRFDGDGDGRAEIWLGAEGWASLPLETVRLSVYDLDTLFEPQIYSEDLLLRALDVFAEEGRSYLYTCYSPSVLAMRGDSYRVDEPQFAPDEWQAIVEAAGSRGPAPDVTTATRPASDVGIAYSAALEQRMPDIARLLSNYDPTPQDFEDWSRAYRGGTVAPEDIAQGWIDANRGRVLQWLLP